MPIPNLNKLRGCDVMGEVSKHFIWSKFSFTITTLLDMQYSYFSDKETEMQVK